MAFAGAPGPPRCVRAPGTRETEENTEEGEETEENTGEGDSEEPKERIHICKKNADETAKEARNRLSKWVDHKHSKRSREKG